jgi:hypothetical protein
MFATHKQALFAPSVYNLAQYELFRMNKMRFIKGNQDLENGIV